MAGVEEITANHFFPLNLCNHYLLKHALTCILPFHSSVFEKYRFRRLRNVKYSLKRVNVFQWKNLSRHGEDGVWNQW